MSEHTDDFSLIANAIDRHAATMERCAKLIAAAILRAASPETIHTARHRNQRGSERKCNFLVNKLWLATAPAQEKRDE